MPNVSDVAGKKSVCRSPVDSVVVGNLTNLDLLAQAGFFAPFRVIPNAKWRVRNHEQGTGFGEQSCYMFRIGRVAAEHAMGTTLPKLSRLSYDSRSSARAFISVILSGGVDQYFVDFALQKSGEVKWKLGRFERHNLRLQRCRDPIGVLVRAVVHQPI